MSASRKTLQLLATALLAACGAAETRALPPAAAPVPGGTPALLGEPVSQSTPTPTPEPSARDRWDAPFAVQSSGGISPRPASVDRVDRAPAVTAVTAVTAAAITLGAGTEPEEHLDTAPTGRAEASTPPDRAGGPAAGSRVAALREAAAARSAAREPRAHRVERGDTWYGIARRYGVAPAALRAANPLADPERIRIGQSLRIPREDMADREASARTHRVEGGDSLWGIARRYGVDLDALRRANRLEGDRVRIGQTLIIPEEGR